ncbi:hypothetical protein CIB95_08415 [Lottiidibacillus patelloidae]|uniref:Uncharacterized protein n=1 Tax=Lottiidibacillus patelloidae TaxID=2670334 RepID=A0A263BVV7_9BACI|nr:hypothetical protein [Lottiidibacillus patelloidae]OZM57467.1 hypothetical protein CIB95_08415 [Lottiidibacillus patelloidae]
MDINSSFHCCATCQHFVVVKENRKTSYYCSRLKYETKPKYQFSCWNPKEQVVSLMEKRKSILEDNNDRT